MAWNSGICCLSSLVMRFEIQFSANNFQSDSHVIDILKYQLEIRFWHFFHSILLFFNLLTQKFIWILCHIKWNDSFPSTSFIFAIIFEFHNYCACELVNCEYFFTFHAYNLENNVRKKNPKVLNYIGMAFLFTQLSVLFRHIFIVDCTFT